MAKQPLALIWITYSFHADYWAILCAYCTPHFRRKAAGHSIRHSVFPSVRPSVRPSFRSSPPKLVDTLFAQAPLQFYVDSFETLQLLLSVSEDMHVVGILSSEHFCHFFRKFQVFYYRSE